MAGGRWGRPSLLALLIEYSVGRDVVYIFGDSICLDVEIVDLLLYLYFERVDMMYRHLILIYVYIVA